MPRTLLSPARGYSWTGVVTGPDGWSAHGRARPRHRDSDRGALVAGHLSPLRHWRARRLQALRDPRSILVGECTPLLSGGRNTYVFDVSSSSDVTRTATGGGGSVSQWTGAVYFQISRGRVNCDRDA